MAKAFNSLLLSRHLLQSQGKHVVNLEWRDRFNRNHDVCGCDLLAFDGSGQYWVQTSKLDKQDAMSRKLASNLDACALLLSGGTILTHGWRLLNKLWTCRVREVFLIREGGVGFQEIGEESVYTDGRGK